MEVVAFLGMTWGNLKMIVLRLTFSKAAMLSLEQQAVAWEYTSTNPTLGATLPEQHSKERAVWSDDEAIEALNVLLLLGLGGAQLVNDGPGQINGAVAALCLGSFQHLRSQF